MAETDLNPAQQIIGTTLSFIAARAIYAAAKLAIADHIGAGGATAPALAARLGVDSAALGRLLRTLTGLGVLRRADTGKFVLTSVGETLRSNTNGSVRDYIIFVHEFLYGLFGGLVGSVRDGKPAVEAMYGMPLFAYLQQNREIAAIFHAGLGNRGRIEEQAILAAYSFAGCRRIVDLGGGNGSFLSAVLTKYPSLSGVLVEQPSAVEAAAAGQGGPLPRCELVDGDYLEAVPRDGDVYVLKRVLFDHSDDEVVKIFGHCRAALAPSGRLLIVEALAAAANEPSLAHLMDLTYMLATAGHMRTAVEYGRLLERAGLRLRRNIPTRSEVSILEAAQP